MGGILSGVTVVALEHVIAAPFATRHLADLGARVIKIERPGGGDFARGYDKRVRGLSSHFVWTAATIDWPAGTITPSSAVFDCTTNWLSGCNAVLP